MAWQERRPEENKRVYLATVAHQAGPLEVSASVDDLFSAHQRVWQGRYPASFVSIPDARAESYYWINTYLLYSTTRADQPPIDVHGMWFFGSAWPNVWWNINVQHAYYSQATANRLELAESLCGTLEKHEENLSLNIPVKAWQADSAWVGRISDQQLRSSWPQVQYMKGILTRLDPPTSYEPEKAWPHGAEVANLSWAMELYWRQCRWAADDQRPPRATNSDHCQLGRPLYIALLPVAFRPRPALDDPLLKYGGLKSGHPQQMERASTMFMSTRQAIERLRLATDSPSMRTVRSALDGQDRTASTGCLWQGDRQA